MAQGSGELYNRFEQLKAVYLQSKQECTILRAQYQELKTHYERLSNEYQTLASKWGAVQNVIASESPVQISKRGKSKKRSPNKAPSSASLKMQHDTIHLGRDYPLS